MFATASYEFECLADAEEAMDAAEERGLRVTPFGSWDEDWAFGLTVEGDPAAVGAWEDYDC